MTAAAHEARVVAVVLNWNGGDETLACLRSLVDLRDPVVVPLLVDNASEDDSVARARAALPGLHVLLLDRNHGYAGGNNLAVRHAFDTLGAEWVCLLNSDVVVARETFTLLLDAVAAYESKGRRRVGAAGPCLLYRDEPETVWACGGRIGAQLNVTQLVGHGRRPKGGPPREVDYLPGAFLLLRRAAWDAAGELDESFFCYLEDADWGVRLRAAGFVSLAVPEAIAWHALSTSTGGGYSAGRKYMTGVNSVHFLRKHGRPAGWAALIVFDILLWPLAFLRALASGRSAGATAKLRGVFAGLRGVRVDAEVAARFARRAT